MPTPKPLKQIIHNMEIVINHSMKIINIQNKNMYTIDVIRQDTTMPLVNSILASLLFLISNLWLNSKILPIINIILNIVMITNE
jgi:hypothetical protein